MNPKNIAKVEELLLERSEISDRLEKLEQIQRNGLHDLKMLPTASKDPAKDYVKPSDPLPFELDTDNSKEAELAATFVDGLVAHYKGLLEEFDKQFESL